MPALLDTNVLVHAANVDSPLHEVATSLVNRGLRQSRVFCIAPQILVEFAAVISRPRHAVVPPSPAEVLRVTSLLYRSRRLAMIYPQRGTVIRAMREGADLGVRGPHWHDLFLAVTMRDAGVREIITQDVEDFRLFPFVRAIHLRDAA
ncbi:MAG: type II toxin-antitoxin system VapC family toxin [Acidobacteria bacterium]|nr:type II toxin-antitoxin system VapC family toxin [Acidobacteriota bacterium]